METVAGIVANLVGSPIELGKYILVPIKRQFSYLCCFNSHINSLKNEAEKLKDVREELQAQVDVAERKAERIATKVQTWLTKANDEIQDNMSGIENEVPNVQSGCLNIISRYSLSKKAKKTTDAMKELRDDSKFNILSWPVPPAARDEIPSKQTYEFESRKHIEKDIMEALESNNIDIIGICGMGGVGKTTMAQRIRSRVKGKSLFHMIVTVVVGKELDRMKVLNEILNQLGSPKAEYLDSARHQLHNQLKGKNKILIVVDDIWEAFQLEELGIPCEDGIEKNHKVLLTSRDKGVLDAMGTQKVCEIETLDEREAKLLFTEKSRICLDDSDLVPIAVDIMKECSGLPLALTTVGSALKGEKVKGVWECFLQQLKNANPIDVPGFLEGVYKPLKASYDLLHSSNAKSLFLLCSLFPEDSDISLEDLTLYCMGLHILEGIRNLEQARNAVITVVEMLKRRFLLLDSSRMHHHVRMHDVVRDVAIFIASKDRLVDINLHSGGGGNNSYSECKWVSFFPQAGNQLPSAMPLNFPSLLILMMHWPTWKRLEIEDFSFLEGMKELRVLSFKTIAFKSIPQTMQLLKYLRELHLEFCTLETVSIVGELSSLEIFCCRDCYNICELPIEIGKLNRLKLLEFSNCYSLNTIPPGVLSSLIELEELTLVRSFRKWELAEAKENESRNVNVSLHELQSLPNLTCLNIEIQDCTLGAEDIHFSSKIVRYHIELGTHISLGTSSFMRNERPLEKKMYFNLPRGITIGNWIHTFVTTTEELHLSGDVSNLSDLLQAPNVKSLNLKKLSLSRLPALEHLWNNPNQIVSLSNLSSITIQNCGLGSLAIAMDSLLQLQYLWIDSCSMMEQVFSSKRDGEKSLITFPQLKRLKLSNLENLTTFCEEVGSIEFPMLTGIYISNCPRITSLVSSIENNQNSASTHLFCSQQESNSFKSLEELVLVDLPALEHLWNNPNQIVSLGNLSSITIEYCALRSLAIAMNSLSQLQSLHIESCSMMEQVFSSKRDGNKSHITLPKLKTLELLDLESLTTFCQEVGSIEFPMLTDILIQNCPRITGLVSFVENNQNSASTHLFCSQEASFGSFPALESLSLSGLHNLEEICDGPIPTGSDFFKNMKELELVNLPALEHLWNNPNHNVALSNLSSITIRECGLCSLAIAMDSLLQLQNLRITSCSMMEQVFSSKRDGNKSRITLPKLKTLELFDLESLTTFCQEVGSIEFPMLTDILIRNCPRITGLVSFIENNQNSASTHLFCSQKVSLDIFPVLKSLKLSGLHNLEEICDSPIPMGSNFFKNIKEIKIEELPKLKHLWKSSQQNEEKEKHGDITTKKKKSIEFPALTDIQIIDCPGLISLVSSSMGIHQNLPNSQDDDSIHLFCKVTFGWLKKLTIERCNNISKIWCHQIPDSFFTGLKEVRIVECDSIRSLFSSAIARNLVNLEKLRIQRCKEMVKVIGDEEEITGETSCPVSSLFPGLKDLTLYSLPELESFCEWRCNIELPMLERLIILECPMMKVFTMGSLISAHRMELIECPKLTSIESPMGPDGNDDNTSHLFCSRTLTSGRLKHIMIEGFNNISKIWCHQIPDGFFTGLRQLNIIGCDSIRSLFSTAITRNLVNLESLTIKECKEMVKVIEDDEETNRQTSCPLVLFPSLQVLMLYSLPKLGSFCEYRCVIELPKLSAVSIDWCPMMKAFTMGSLIRTPNWRCIAIENQDGGVRDLNELVKLHCYTKGGDEGRAEIVE